RRSNPLFLRGPMDCFAALAMTVDRSALLLRCCRTRLDPVLRSRMLLRQPCSSRTEQLLSQSTLRIRALVAPTPCQLRHQHVRNILEIARRGGERDVEAVDIGLLEPSLDIVGDLFGRADHDRPGAGDADMLAG